MIYSYIIWFQQGGFPSEEEEEKEDEESESARLMHREPRNVLENNLNKKKKV